MHKAAGLIFLLAVLLLWVAAVPATAPAADPAAAPLDAPAAAPPAAPATPRPTPQPDNPPATDATILPPTRLLGRPAVSENHIAFIYAGDLWLADLDGGNPRRLAEAAPASTYMMYNPDGALPAFSPDGKSIAFSALRGGNVDVYLIPVEGGTPRRLTWHPADDQVQGWSPDGSSIYFSSERESCIHGHAISRYTQLYRISAQGGHALKQPLAGASAAAFSPDGKRLVYNPMPQAFNQWKRYRGGTASVLWICDLADLTTERIPQPEPCCNDVSPMWMGDKIYFRSDRNGEFNLYSFDPESREIKQLTFHQDFPVISASAGAGKIIYEQAGLLHLLDPESATSRQLSIHIPETPGGRRAANVKGADFIQFAGLSPRGGQAIFEMHGDVVMVAADGSWKNLTRTPGVMERRPIWSRDGKRIAYFSDASGEYQLVVRTADGVDSPRRYPLQGSGFYYNPTWSPDGSKICYTDNSYSLYLLDLHGGAVRRLASRGRVNDSAAFLPVWSADSKWIAYSLDGPANFNQIRIYSVEQAVSHNLTDFMCDAISPAFDSSGRYLYFLGSTDSGPLEAWFNQSQLETSADFSIYALVLDHRSPSPLSKEAGKLPPSFHSKIDLSGISERVVTLPLPPGDYSSLKAGPGGVIFYLKGDKQGRGAETGALCRFEPATGRETVLARGVLNYQVAPDQAAVIYLSADKIHRVVSLAGTSPRYRKVAVDKIRIWANPAAQWPQMFREAWRVNRDFFYDPNLHGVDWEAMYRKYAVFIPDLTSRDDCFRVMQWMCSELVVGHHFIEVNQPVDAKQVVPVGLLGADYEVKNGKYVFRKIFRGPSWDPRITLPLSAPGLGVREGEYLLKVNGKPISANREVYAWFQNLAGKSVTLTIGPDASGAGARNIEVTPVDAEYGIRNQDWVEENRRRVAQASSGRVGYIWLPDTALGGHNNFRRLFYPQNNCEAFIIDERFNGGGFYADYCLDMLRRMGSCYMSGRYGKDSTVPVSLFQGPTVMMSNEMSASGGDLLPWTYRKFGLGKLVGKRTWGGLVGIVDFPSLMEGTQVTAPNLGIWSETGWVAENEGVSPDISVEQLPADIAAGRDTQLEEAIRVVMEQLPATPSPGPVRPPYPIKNR